MIDDIFMQAALTPGITMLTFAPRSSKESAKLGVALKTEFDDAALIQQTKGLANKVMVGACAAALDDVSKLKTGKNTMVRRGKQVTDDFRLTGDVKSSSNIAG